MVEATREPEPRSISPAVPPAPMAAQRFWRVALLLVFVWGMRTVSEIQALRGGIPLFVPDVFTVTSDVLTCIVIAYCLYICFPLLRSRSLVYLLIAGCLFVVLRSALRVFPEISDVFGLTPRQLSTWADGVLAFGGLLILVGTFCYLLISLRDAFLAIEAESVALRESIAAREAAQRELANKERQIQQVQKMESVGRLAGGVAHDFNNMLAIIIGSGEMAIKKIDREHPAYDQLLDVLNAAKHSADLTRQLLAFARKQTIRPKVLDLNEAVTSMAKILQRLLGEDVALIWQPKRDLWSVRMDPTQVDQILANLLTNARDAIGERGEVTIGTDNVVLNPGDVEDVPDAEVGEYVALVVSDTGVGMDKATRESAFEPFFTTKEMGKGTGLGLSTVYGIVKQNGGIISVHGEPGRGTTFRIYLPRHVDQDREREQSDVRPAPEHGTETLLFVEDEVALLNMGKVMLEELGYTVLVADSPGRALQIAETHERPIDLLVIDVVMPGMNGRELADRLAAMRPGVKRLYISGYPTDAIARHGVLDEGVEFLSKPFSIKTLAETVRKALRTGS